MCCSATGRAGHRWANAVFFLCQSRRRRSGHPSGRRLVCEGCPDGSRSDPRGVRAGGLLAADCGQEAASAHADGEGADVLGLPVLAAATAAFASARTDEAPRAATRAGQVADGACALGGSVTSMTTGAPGGMGAWR